MNCLFIFLPIFISRFIFRMLLVIYNRSYHGFNKLEIQFSDIKRSLEGDKQQLVQWFKLSGWCLTAQNGCNCSEHRFPVPDRRKGLWWSQICLCFTIRVKAFPDALPPNSSLCLIHQNQVIRPPSLQGNWEIKKWDSDVRLGPIVIPPLKLNTLLRMAKPERRREQILEGNQHCLTQNLSVFFSFRFICFSLKEIDFCPIYYNIFPFSVCTSISLKAVGIFSIKNIFS